VFVDTLRGDHVLGTNRDTSTPTIDALARRSTVFTRAFATASTTTMSAASTLTGTYPYVHGVRLLAGQRLPAGIPTLAEAFRASGYHTWAEVTGPLVAASGLNRGFDEYHYREHTDWLDTEFGDDLRARLRDSTLVPWFGFLHLWEIHNPRRVTRAFRDAQYGSTVYARAVSSLDHQLGLLFEVLPPDTAVVLTADHGEYLANSAGVHALARMKGPTARLKRAVPSVRRLRRPLRRAFWAILGRGETREHMHRAWLGHGFHVFDQLTHVPIMFSGVPGLPAGVERADVVSHVDIVPTLIAAFALRGDTSAVNGIDLRRSEPASPADDRAVYMEASGARLRNRPELWLRGLRTSRYKYARGLTNDEIGPELFDLETDPDESRNIAAEEPEVATALDARLRAFEPSRPAEGPAEGYSADEMAEVEERLRDLGYLD